MAAFERAEKANRNFRGTRYLNERKSAARTQSAEALAGKWDALCWCRDYTQALQYVDDGRGIQSLGAAQKNSALQQTHIAFRVQTVKALRAMRRDEAQRFPGAQGRRRDTHATRHLADAQQPPRSIW